MQCQPPSEPRWLHSSISSRGWNIEILECVWSSRSSNQVCAKGESWAIFTFESHSINSDVLFRPSTSTIPSLASATVCCIFNYKHYRIDATEFMGLLCTLLVITYYYWQWKTTFSSPVDSTHTHVFGATAAALQHRMKHWGSGMCLELQKSHSAIFNSSRVPPLPGICNGLLYI